MTTVLQQTANAVPEPAKLAFVDSTKSQQSKSTRPANGMERTCIARESLNFYGYIMTVGTYTRPLSPNECVSQDIIFKALKHCITKHHALCTVVRDADTEAPTLRQSPWMDLTKHQVTFDAVDDNGPETVLQFIRDAHDLKLHPGHPQWRVIQLPIRSTVADKILFAFVCSHSFIDARSAYSFHQTFVQALRDVENLSFTTSPYFMAPTNYTLPTAVNDKAQLSVSPELLQAAKQGFASDRSFWKGSSLKADGPFTDFPPYAMDLVIIPNALVQKAVVACRQHSSKLTALLDHLVAHACARALHRRGQHHTKFAAFTPLDMRATLQYSSDVWGNVVSSHLETIEVDPATFDGEPVFRGEDWDKVRVLTDVLLQRSKSLVDHTTRLLDYLSSVKKWLYGLLESPRNETFTLSNPGTFVELSDASDPSTWSIEDMVFSQHSYRAGPVLFFNVTSTKKGPLNMTVTWLPGAIGVGDDSEEQIFVREVCADIVLFLETVAKEAGDVVQ